MNYEVAKSSMKFLATMGKAGILENSGISRGDFDRLVGDLPWLASERQRMTTALQTLIMGSIDALGLPRFNVPAEYNAAGIAVFIHPINVHACCVFMSTTPDAESMGRKSTSQGHTQVDHVQPDKLFALVAQLWSDSARTGARAAFEKNSGLALSEAEKKGTKS